MNQDEIQKRVEDFLSEMDVPSFIVLGFQKDDNQFGVVSSHHKVPKNAAVKGMSWALNDFVQKAL